MDTKLVLSSYHYHPYIRLEYKNEFRSDSEIPRAASDLHREFRRNIRMREWTTFSDYLLAFNWECLKMQKSLVQSPVQSLVKILNSKTFARANFTRKYNFTSEIRNFKFAALMVEYSNFEGFRWSIQKVSSRA